MTPYYQENDETLVELTLLGNERAYEELVTRHERSVKGTAYKVTNNEYSAEDASQDAFVSAWMNLDSLRERDRFGPWVCSIAKNCARTIVARYRSTVPDISYDLLENLDLTDSDESGLPELLRDNGPADELREAVEALGAKIREAVVLHYFENLSVKEIAAKLSLPAGTVKWRLSEGRKQLRKGFGVMEKNYNEDENIVVRVMRQVENLKLWKLKDDKTGFEDDYREVLKNVEALDESKEKAHALADVLKLGYWWIPGQKSKEVFAKIKKAAEDGHNDEVMQFVMNNEHDKFDRQEKIDYMRETQVPYLEQHGFRKSLGYVLFWMGREYCVIRDFEKAIETYRRVTEVLEPQDVYYANAKAAIHCEERMVEALKTNDFRHNSSPAGEIFRYIGNKMYFIEQPGYGYSSISGDGSVFWNCAQCDSMIYDPDMKPGDEVKSSDGKMTLTFAESGVGVDTAAGHFDGCDVFISDGERYGMKYCKTWFCRGVGIVKQCTERNDRKNTWELSSYKIEGGDGMIPFAAGNRWEYVCLTPDTAVRCERENIFGVTAFRGGQATVSESCFVLNLGYLDTWEGNTVKARKNYYTEDDNHIAKGNAGVKPALDRAVELADTKRRKVHACIAREVMNRIIDTDPESNPDYTEKGRWNFFAVSLITNKDGCVSVSPGNRKYSFEWKNIGGTGTEGLKVLYSFLYDILDDAAGCVWSDEWTDGYEYEGDRHYYGQSNHTKLHVTDAGSVTVPAETFENCRKVSIERTGLTGGLSYRGGRFDYFFAPGVGMVKMVHPMDETTETVWELTAYKGTGNGYFPTDDGIFRRYEPSSLGDGFRASVEYTFDTDETGTVMFCNRLGTQSRAEYERMTAEKTS